MIQIFAWLGCVSDNRHRNCRTCNFDYLVNKIDIEIVEREILTTYLVDRKKNMIQILFWRE